MPAIILQIVLLIGMKLQLIYIQQSKKWSNVTHRISETSDIHSSYKFYQLQQINTATYGSKTALQLLCVHCILNLFGFL